MDLNRRIEAAATFLRLQGCEASRFVGMWLTSAEGRAIKRQWVEPERRESPSHFLSRLPAMLISTSSGSQGRAPDESRSSRLSLRLPRKMVWTPPARRGLRSAASTLMEARWKFGAWLAMI